MQQATAVLKKLNAIAKAGKNIPYLPEIVKKAADDVNEFTGGGVMSLLKKGMSAIQQKLGAKAGANPILKSIMLANALESGFRDMSDVISNNLPDYDPAGGSLTDQAKNDKAIIKNITNAFKKAFVPEGIFAKLKSLIPGGSGGIPYVDNVDALVQGIMDSDGQSLSAVVKAAAAGGGTEQVTQAVKDMVQQGKSSGEKVAEVPKSGQALDQKGLAAAVGAGEEAKGQEGAAAKAAEQPRSAIQDLVNGIAAKSGQDPDIVGKVLKALIAKNKIKFAMKESVTKLGFMYDDIVDAQYALLECGGSVKKWCQMLIVEATPSLSRKKKREKDPEVQKRAAAHADKNQPSTTAKGTTGTNSSNPSSQSEPSAPTTTSDTAAAKPETKSSQPNKEKAPPEDAKPEVVGKHDAVIKTIQNDLAGIEADQISAVLDALPDYLVAESKKYRNL
jgi:hypothetical protein